MKNGRQQKINFLNTGVTGAADDHNKPIAVSATLEAHWPAYAVQWPEPPAIDPEARAQLPVPTDPPSSAGSGTGPT
jgi:hypothetical protein